MTEKTLDARYKAVLSAAHDYLKPRGYLKSGAEFRRMVSGNRVIMQFQKSAWNSADSLQFTVNFAIVSSRLATENGEDPAKLGSEWQGHARARIGRFQDKPNDKWWTLDSVSSVAAILSELLPLLERGTEFFEANASDSTLAALWNDSVGPNPTLSRIASLRVEVGSLAQS